MAQQAINPTLTEFVTLEATRCWCGVAFAVERGFLQHQRDKSGEIYCPLGHRGVYNGAPENERLRKELDRAKQETEYQRQRVESERKDRLAAERKVSAARGRITKLKNRSAAGVCPVPDCHRHFTNLERHMGTKHPGYAGQDIG